MPLFIVQKNVFAQALKKRSGQFHRLKPKRQSSTSKIAFTNWHNGQADAPQFQNFYTLNWGGCSNVNVSPNAVRAAGRLGGDVFALTGDFIYIDGKGPQNYARYLREFRKAMHRADWQSVIKSHGAVIGVQDDHDYGKDGFAGADDGINTWAWEAYRAIMPQPAGRTFFSWETGGVKFFMLDARLYAHSPKHQSSHAYPVFLGKDQWDWFRNEYARHLQKLNVVILPMSPAFASSHGGGSQVRLRSRQMLRDFLNQHDANCLLLTSDRHACGHAKYSPANAPTRVHEFLAGPMGTRVRHTVSFPEDIEVAWSNATPTQSAPSSYSAFGSLFLDKADQSATVTIYRHDGVALYTYKLPNII